MAREIAWPSASNPGPPDVSLEIPDDWEELLVPGVVLAVAGPAEPKRFRTNLVVSVQRMPAGHGLDRVRRTVQERLGALPQLERLGDGDLDCGGRTWYAAEYGYTHPGRPTVIQASRATTFAHPSGVIDVVDVVGSCGAEDADAQIVLLRSVQDSVRLAS